MTGRTPFLTAEWRDLLILNYEVAPEVLAPFIPRHTMLDLFEGRALVSLVGFNFLDTRVRGLAIPGHRNFEELNFRFYIITPDPRGRHATGGLLYPRGRAQDRHRPGRPALVRRTVPRPADATHIHDLGERGDRGEL